MAEPQAETCRPPTATPRSASRKTRWADAATITGLAVVTLLIGAKDLTRGGFSWSDAPVHAMDGVFLHDLVTERPAGSLGAWAEQYYLRHQCLGLIVYYPPLFGAVEAIVFLALGVSVWAARLTVVLWAFGATWLIYVLARGLFGRFAGIGAALLSIASSGGVVWSRQVMLEWPATFFIVLALLAYCRHLKRPSWSAGTLTALACLAAYLTKQTAGFVLPLIVLHAWRERCGSAVLRRSFLIPLGTAITLVAGYAWATRGYNALAPELLLGSPPLRHALRLEAWTWYLAPARLITSTGWPLALGAVLVVLALLGRYIADSVHGVQMSLSGDRAARVSSAPPARDPGEPRTQGSLVLPALWFFSWWTICSLIAAKEERYFFFAVPALAIVVAGGLVRLNRRHGPALGSLALVGICAAQMLAAVRMPALRLSDMKPTVTFLARQSDADLVLVDSVRDGQFIFDVRTTPAARDRIIAMRASKFLYSRSARTQYDYQVHIQTPGELYEWLARYGIRYLVMEDRLPRTTDRSWDAPPRIMLRETVFNNPRFELVCSQPLAGDDPAWRDVRLLTYRYLDAKPRRSQTVTIPVPAMRREVTLPLPAPATQSVPG